MAEITTTQIPTAMVTLLIDGVKNANNSIEWNAKAGAESDYNTFIDKLKISGKCNRVRVRVVHEHPTSFKLNGFGIVTKYKKP